MPTYEYRCTQCGRRFEVVQRIDDEPLTTCEVCGGELRKVFHAAGIVFKGSGFYATDSRKSSTSTRGDSKGSETSDGKKPSSSEGGKTSEGGPSDGGSSGEKKKAAGSS